MFMFLNSFCAVRFCLSIPCLLSHALLLCQTCRMLCAMSQPASPVPFCKPRKTSAPSDFSFAFCYNIRVVLLLYFRKLLYTEIFLISSGSSHVWMSSWQNWSLCFVHFPWRCCTLSLLFLCKGNEILNCFLSRVLWLMYIPKTYCLFRSEDDVEREAIFFWHLIGKVSEFLTPVAQLIAPLLQARCW